MIIKSYQVVKGFALLALVLIFYQITSLVLPNIHWTGVLVSLFVILPCILVILLAKKQTYDTKLKMLCRSISGFLVSGISIFSFIAIQQADDPMVGVAVLYMVGVQYLALFFAEVIIGMVMYLFIE